MLRRDFLSSLIVSISATHLGVVPSVEGMKNVLDFGAKPDGTTLNTQAIQRAIDDVFRSGGGTVYLPAGRFLSGRIDLKSRVGLYFGEGSVLLGSTSIDDYHSADLRSSEKHLIYAHDADELTLAGPGRIDGQGNSFWEPSGKVAVKPEDAWADVASHALKAKQTGRPSPMIRFANCRKVRVAGVHLENSAGWTLHALNCDGVEIKGIAIKNPIDGPNTDGIDLTGCQDVSISDCSIETGDDAICLKSIDPYGGEPRLLRNIKVTNCRLSTCCNAFKLGTDSQGGFENIEFSNSTIYSGPGPFGQRVISGVALEVTDGGWIDGVKVSGIEMQRTRTPIFIRLGHRKQDHVSNKHGLRNVSIDKLRATEALLASSITGMPGDEVRDITLSDITVGRVLTARPESIAAVVPEKERDYPEAHMFGTLPASGLYVRHVRGLQLDRVALSAPSQEARPTIILDDVDGARITAFSSTRVNGSMPIVNIANGRNVTISGSTAPAGTATFVGVSGKDSANVVLSGDDLSGARHAFETGRDAPKQAVTVTAGNSSVKK